jgi:hypothetical protein
LVGFERAAWATLIVRVHFGQGTSERAEGTLNFALQPEHLTTTVSVGIDILSEGACLSIVHYKQASAHCSPDLAATGDCRGNLWSISTTITWLSVNAITTGSGFLDY